MDEKVDEPINLVLDDKKLRELSIPIDIKRGLILCSKIKPIELCPKKPPKPKSNSMSAKSWKLPQNQPKKTYYSSTGNNKSADNKIVKLKYDPKLKKVIPKIKKVSFSSSSDDNLEDKTKIKLNVKPTDIDLLLKCPFLSQDQNGKLIRNPPFPKPWLYDIHDSFQENEYQKNILKNIRSNMIPDVSCIFEQYNQIQNYYFQLYKYENDVLTSLLSEKAKQAQELSLKCNTIESQEKELVRMLQETNLKYSEEQNTNLRLQEELKTISQEKEDLLSKLESLQITLGQIDNDKRFYDDRAYKLFKENCDNEELKKQIEQFKSDPDSLTIQQKNDLVKMLLQKISDLEEENERIKNENAYFKEKIEEYEHSTSLLNENIQTLEQQIHDLLIEYEKTKKELKIKNLQLAIAKNRYKREKRKAKLILQNKKLDKLEIVHQIDELDTGEVPPSHYSHEIIEELVRNDPLPKQAYKFSPKTYEIAFVLYTYSPSCYEILRNIIPLPSEVSVRGKFSEAIKRKQDNLLNLDQVKLIYDQIRSSYEIDETQEVVSSIAFDAASADPKHTNTNNIFVYNLQPLNQSLDSHVIHISPKSNGKASQDIISNSDDIAKIASTVHIHVIYRCTDGDPNTNDLHSDFQKYMKHCPSHNFKDMIEYANRYSKLIPITDWLHLLKNLRSRLIHQDILLSTDLPVLDFVKLSSQLQIDEDIYKASSQLAMRDDLALKIFTTTNLAKLFDSSIWNEFIFIIPFVLVTNVIQSGTLSVDARIELLELSYNLIDVIDQESEGYPESPKQHSKNACYLTNSQKMRAQNTILALAHALTFHSDNINLSRLGTHLVEFVFGNMRRVSHQKDTPDALISSLVKTDLCSEIIKKYKLKQKRKGRVNFGGSKYDSDLWVKGIPFDIEHSNIINEVLEILHSSIDDRIGTQLPFLNKLVHFLDEFSPSPEIVMSRDISGAAPYVRNIIYNKKHE